MKFGHVELFVENPEITKNFYVNILGFDLVDDNNPKTIWVKIGEIELLLREGRTSKSPIYQQTNSALVLYTDELDETKLLLQERGLDFRGIDGSDKCLTFQDPDGHWLQLVNPNDH